MNPYKWIIMHLVAYYRSNDLYNWFILRRQKQKAALKDLLPYYGATSSSEVGTNQDNVIVIMFEGHTCSFGLADRFRGILSVYAICKQLGRPFRIYFCHPFFLTDYLIPNMYDWRIDRDSICLNKEKANIIVLHSTIDNHFQFKRQYYYLFNRLRSSDKQTHVYTNAAFSYDLEYSLLFNELFKPSDRLSASIESIKKGIGDQYLSVSARFLGLLGDFEDTISVKPLNDVEKTNLIERCIGQLQKLHSSHINKKILVNSDSSSFLDAVSQFPYVYVIPGTITHIDAKQSVSSYEQFEKTFLDFFMIANAEEIFLLKSSRMHNSGYPYAASLVYGKPYHVVVF